MNTYLIKAIASVPLLCAAIIPQSALADLDESDGYVTSIDYSTRQIKLQDHTEIKNFRILYDAIITLPNGQRGSIGSITNKSSISFVYDDVKNSISYVEILDRPR